MPIRSKQRLEPQPGRGRYFGAVFSLVDPVGCSRQNPQCLYWRPSLWPEPQGVEQGRLFHGSAGGVLGDHRQPRSPAIQNLQRYLYPDYRFSGRVSISTGTRTGQLVPLPCVRQRQNQGKDQERHSKNATSMTSSCDDCFKSCTLPCRPCNS